MTRFSHVFSDTWKKKKTESDRSNRHYRLWRINRRRGFTLYIWKDWSYPMARRIGATAWWNHDAPLLFFAVAKLSRNRVCKLVPIIISPRKHGNFVAEGGNRNGWNIGNTQARTMLSSLGNIYLPGIPFSSSRKDFVWLALARPLAVATNGRWWIFPARQSQSLFSFVLSRGLIFCCIEFSASRSRPAVFEPLLSFDCVPKPLSSFQTSTLTTLCVRACVCMRVSFSAVRGKKQEDYFVIRGFRQLGA